MFDNLSDRLGGVFDRLRGRGALTEADVRQAMREVRIALLEADVALPVARQFVEDLLGDEHPAGLAGGPLAAAILAAAPGGGVATRAVGFDGACPCCG